MSLVGGMAGLATWCLILLMPWLPMTMSSWLVTLVATSAMGTLIGGLTVAFADKWSAERMVARWVAAGFALGLLAGACTGLIAIPVQGLALRSASQDLIVRVLIWVIAGGLIGLVTGLRWVTVNPFRALHASIGGMLGGAVGGLMFSTLAGRHPFFDALAYVCTGLGIALGVTLAPVLLRDGILQFISSGDARAQNKYGTPRQEWLIQRGDQYVIGSQGADMSMTMYARDVQIYIPDAMVAPRHALLFERRKRFYLQQHGENVGPQGQPLSALTVGNMNVVGTHELHDGDEIVVGQTLLRFLTRRKRAESERPAQEGWAR
jgi:hypothetical protein